MNPVLAPIPSANEMRHEPETAKVIGRVTFDPETGERHVIPYDKPFTVDNTQYSEDGPLFS